MQNDTLWKRFLKRTHLYFRYSRRYSLRWLDYLQIRFRSERARNIFVQSVVVWIASFLVGLIAVVYARFFAWAERSCLAWFEYDSLLAFLVLPVFFVAAWWIVQRFAPSARGSGIPQLMAAVELANASNRHLTGYFLGLRVIAVKILSSLTLVLGGGASGREGPTLQIAASVFKVVHDILPANWPRVSERIMLMTGGAAGLSAAFNTPLGGIVFVVEELSKIHIAQFRNFVFTGVIISGMTAQWLNGPYLYLGYPKTGGGGAQVFALTIFIGLVTGLGGVLFTRTVYRLARWRDEIFGKSYRVLYVFLLGLVAASMAYFLTPASLGSGKEQMSHFLFSEESTADIRTVLARFFAPAVSFSSGAAAGIFAPSLSTGASIGAWVAQFFDLAKEQSNILVLAGMTGFLASVTRSPFTAAILVLEMTDRHSVIFFLMLAAMVGYLVASSLEKEGIYDRFKRDYLKGVRSIPSAPSPLERGD